MGRLERRLQQAALPRSKPWLKAPCQRFGRSNLGNTSDHGGLRCFENLLLLSV